MAKELQLPSTLLATCRTSYFVSAYEYFASHEYKDDFIFLIANCPLKFCDLDANIMKKQYNNNPWAYQQVKLFSCNNFLFSDDRSLDEICDFLHLFDIDIMRYELEEKSVLIDAVIEQLSLNKVVILSVDEFYNPHNPNYYQKGYNKHYLGVRSIQPMKQTIEIIDTEQSTPYYLSYDDIFIAYENPFYVISCGKYKNQINLQEILKKYRSHHCDDQYLDHFIIRIKQDLFTFKSRDINYFLRGYLFCVTYQIIPVVKLRWILFKRLYAKSQSIGNLLLILEELYQEWNDIRLILVKCVYTNCIKTHFLNHLSILIDKEKSILKSIKDLIDKGGQ
jgi:hypothetical protein